MRWLWPITLRAWLLSLALGLATLVGLVAS
jgi:hypothetical protein